MDARILVLRKVEAQERIKTAVHALTKLHGLKLATEGMFAKSNDPAITELLFLQGYADFTESLLKHFEKVGNTQPRPAGGQVTDLPLQGKTHTAAAIKSQSNTAKDSGTKGKV